MSAGGHASAIATILPPEIWYKNREGYTCFPHIRKMVFTYPDERPEGDSIKMFRLPLVAQHDSVTRSFDITMLRGCSSRHFRFPLHVIPGSFCTSFPVPFVRHSRLDRESWDDNVESLLGMRMTELI